MVRIFKNVEHNLAGRWSGILNKTLIFEEITNTLLILRYPAHLIFWAKIKSKPSNTLLSFKINLLFFWLLLFPIVTNTFLKDNKNTKVDKVILWLK